MRYMIMVRANADTEAGLFPDDVDQLMADMAAFHEELARAGVLLDVSGLQPSSAGFRVEWDGRGQRVVDGPFAESKELVAGYTLIQVRSREEALEWARRYPNPMGRGRAGAIEVRPLYELEHFEQKGIHGAERFRELGTL
ncbi:MULTISPECIES: YciI family protein [Ramlibacter]|uniref:YciI family protein n=1 Tax=Ramlibacter pinisoli TaxID=2682844 RepID=A0A6N8IS73_9BURK|nr:MULTISPECIES: YciI family protein [Ramlibacter]MBA2964739.1 YciI family protein [Ramlibacter sp. CGMCC 1.13660]MVQ29704.1 YciI family protein [Ramlibacter pinisoli]